MLDVESARNDHGVDGLPAFVTEYTLGARRFILIRVIVVTLTDWRPFLAIEVSRCWGLVMAIAVFHFSLLHFVPSYVFVWEVAGCGPVDQIYQMDIRGLFTSWFVM